MNREVVRALADQLRERGAAWFDQWLRAHFYYRPESEEVLRAIDWQLDDLARSGRIEGDCDDVATFIAAVAIAAGYPTRFVAARFDSYDLEFAHVFVEALIGQWWIRFDPTIEWGIIPPEVERLNYGV